MQIDAARDVLGIVDVQPTFMPGGELPVVGGDEVVPIINRLLDRFTHAFATQDWHPAGHASFASTHRRGAFSEVELAYGPQTLWPDHAIQGSANAELHRDLASARIEAVIRKGFHPEVDSYSSFFENDHRTPTGLDGWLKVRGFKRIFFAGLATDYCVAWSAEDAAGLGYEVVVIEDACRGIGLTRPDGRTTMQVARERLLSKGVTLIASRDLE